MAIENKIHIPVNGAYEVFHPETSLQGILDMTALIRTLCKAEDAETAPQYWLLENDSLAVKNALPAWQGVGSI